jgi:hypothetical protein
MVFDFVQIEQDFEYLVIAQFGVFFFRPAADGDFHYRCFKVIGAVFLFMSCQ